MVGSTLRGMTYPGPPQVPFAIVPCKLVTKGQRACENLRCRIDHTTCAWCYTYECFVCQGQMCDDCINTLTCEGYPPLPVCRRICFTQLFKDLIDLNRDNYKQVIAKYIVMKP